MAKKPKLVDGGSYFVEQFYGLNTSANNAKDLPDGQPQDSLNWITGYNVQEKTADNIQLRLGSALLCKTRQNIVGKVNALKVGTTVAGVQIPMWAAAGELNYFNSATADIQNISTLPATEDMSIENYTDLIGNYFYISSPNTGFYMIPSANPGSISPTLLQIYGLFRIISNYIWMWNYKYIITNFKNNSLLLQSSVDVSVASTLTNYSIKTGATTVTGTGVGTSYTGTLQTISQFPFSVTLGAPTTSYSLTQVKVPTALIGGLPNTYDFTYTGATGIFSEEQLVVVQGVTTSGEAVWNDIIGQVVSVSGNIVAIQYLNNPPTPPTNGTYLINGTLSPLEFFTDDQNGNFTSNLGNKGTFNYQTSVFSVTTAVPIPNGLNLDSIYFTGIPTILNVANNTLLQDGGAFQGVGSYNGSLYDFHLQALWNMSTAGSSQIKYLNKVGIPYFRSYFETGDGIEYVDNVDQNNPHLRILTTAAGSTQVLPESLSDDLDLSMNSFQFSVVARIGQKDFLACQSIINVTPQTYNDICYLRDVISGFWDKTDFRIACIDEYNGQPIAGDSLSPNILQLFTGLDDDGGPINNQWTGGQMDLGFSGGKRFNFFYIDGYIGPSQILNIYAQFDSGEYVLIGSVFGNGSHIDMNDTIVVGKSTIGANNTDSQDNGQMTGYHFERQLPFYSPIFNYVSIMFVAGENLTTNEPAYGALQINSGWGFMDCRIKTTKSQYQYVGK